VYFITHISSTVHVLLARDSARFAGFRFSPLDASAAGAADRWRVFRSANCKTDFDFRRKSGQIRAAKMGNSWTHYVSEPQNRPDFDNPPTFDPLQGFPNGRKERGETQKTMVLFFGTVPLAPSFLFGLCLEFFNLHSGDSVHDGNRDFGGRVGKIF
jgi:hypothetical protein